jgi:hypothetical protein
LIEKFFRVDEAFTVDEEGGLAFPCFILIL